MENVPWHSDVKEFSDELTSKGGGVYEVACDHVHSCCLLHAKVDKFKITANDILGLIMIDSMNW
jgi:tRNA wybutosine-synthesizing protein 1